MNSLHRISQILLLTIFIHGWTAAAASGACASGIYALIAPLLGAEGEIQNYCSSSYYVPPPTVTITRTSTSTSTITADQTVDVPFTFTTSVTQTNTGTVTTTTTVTAASTSYSPCVPAGAAKRIMKRASSGTAKTTSSATSKATSPTANSATSASTAQVTSSTATKTTASTTSSHTSCSGAICSLGSYAANVVSTLCSCVQVSKTATTTYTAMASTSITVSPKVTVTTTVSTVSLTVATTSTMVTNTNTQTASVTVTMAAKYNPSAIDSCNESAQSNCDNGGGTACGCFPTTEGDSVCIIGGSGGTGARCSSSCECGSNQRCLQLDIPESYVGLCYGSSDSCPDPASKRWLFGVSRF